MRRVIHLKGTNVTSTCTQCRIGFTPANYDRPAQPIYAPLEKRGNYWCCTNCGASFGEVMNIEDLKRHVVHVICNSPLTDPRDGNEFTEAEKTYQAKAWLEIETAFNELRKRISPLSLGLIEQLQLLYNSPPQGDGTEVPAIRNALHKLTGETSDPRPADCKERIIDSGAKSWPRTCQACKSAICPHIAALYGTKPR